MTRPHGNPVLIPLRKGDMITIHWSGEPRRVVIDDAHGVWCLRDLTDDETRQLDEQIAQWESNP